MAYCLAACLFLILAALSYCSPVVGLHLQCEGQCRQGEEPCPLNITLAICIYTDGQYESAGACVACPSECLNSGGRGHCGKRHRHINK